MCQKEEAERLLQQTEQQVSILKAALDRANKAKEHAEAQVCATVSRAVFILLSVASWKGAVMWCDTSMPAGERGVHWFCCPPKSGGETASSS